MKKVGISEAATIEFPVSPGDGKPSSASAKKPSALLARSRVRILEGAAPELADEELALIVQRLKLASLVLLVSMSVHLLIRTIFYAASAIVLSRALLLGTLLACYVLLRWIGNWTIVRLRIVEAIMFGGVGLTLVVNHITMAVKFAERGEVASVVSLGAQNFSFWAVVIFLYGMLVPNNWRRAAAIIIPASLVPGAVALWLYWQAPEVASIYQADHYGLPITSPFIAAFASVFFAHAFDRLRKREFRLRQFGQYRLGRKIGGGGMGVVHEAEHLLLKRRCVIKMIRPGDEFDSVALAQFEREVQATSTLTHWNIVAIYDYGRTLDGALYYVMEKLNGLSLQEIVAKTGPMPSERVVHFLREACAGLREAHAVGFIHRDLKPANLFSASVGGIHDVTKVLDFGLVKEANQKEVSEESGELLVAGSPLYMAPEQAFQPDLVDARTDIYALGCVGYFLVTGQTPFPTGAPSEVVRAHLKKEATSPRKLATEMCPDLEAVLMKCLKKSQSERFQTVEALATALDACQSAGAWNSRRAEVWWNGFRVATHSQTSGDHHEPNTEIATHAPSMKLGASGA